MKIAIIGADGQLGTDLCKVIPKQEQIPLTIKDINITEESLVDRILAKYRPDIVVNTAAYHKVDDCENNVGIALKVNAVGARNLALACRKINSALVHISTDYVFSGDKGSPYSIEDTPNPMTAYGISKLSGELFVRYILPEHFIVRSSGLYGAAGCLGKGGTNFVEGMLKRAAAGEKIKVVTDEIVAPTYTFDLAGKIYELAKTKNFGLYHVSNSGQCSWWEFASKIFELLNLKVKVDKTVAADFKVAAHRPQFSVLKNNINPLRPWQEALKAYLIEKGHLK